MSEGPANEEHGVGETGVVHPREVENTIRLQQAKKAQSFQNPTGSMYHYVIRIDQCSNNKPFLWLYLSYVQYKLR
jgi:hypothetical protein